MSFNEHSHLHMHADGVLHAHEHSHANHEHDHDHLDEAVGSGDGPAHVGHVHEPGRVQDAAHEHSDMSYDSSTASAVSFGAGAEWFGRVRSYSN